VTFSDQGEKQFAPHRNKAKEHFAEIVFVPDGLTSHAMEKFEARRKEWRKEFAAATTVVICAC
jgi:hypothetical protein